MSFDFGLENVHVLITGAAGGIGLETVKTFRRLGARVTAQYNSKIGGLASLDGVVSIQADVRDESSVQHLLEEAAMLNKGPVSILLVVHGTFVNTEIPMADLSLHQWQNTLAINLTGSFLLCREYLRALRTAPEAAKRTANVVLIGSTAGKFGEAGHADYATSKSGLMYGFTNTLKNEIVRIAPQARVNSVSPGWVSTPLSAKALEDAGTVARATSTVSLRKVATTEDIARQIAVLSSPIMSGHVTGMNVMVDGGMEGRLLFPAGPS